MTTPNPRNEPDVIGLSFTAMPQQAPRPVGGYYIGSQRGGGSIRFLLLRRPPMVARLFMRWLLNWQWEDDK